MVSKSWWKDGSPSSDGGTEDTRGTDGRTSKPRALPMRGRSGKHSTSKGRAVCSSRTLLRLANLHWDVRKRNFDCPWSSVVLVIVLPFVADYAALHKWVDVGAVRVSLTSADERDTTAGQAAVSCGVPMTSTGVSRQNGPILLITSSEIILNAIGSFLG